jgi:hypothetical protein
MFGSTSLETATGLIFIFLLLSVLVTAVGEMIASMLNSRAKCLWKGIEAMLESSQLVTAAENSWTVKLYEHAILRPLMPLKSQGKESELGPKGKGPSYIQAKNFAAALLDITGMNNAHINDWQRKLQDRLAGVSNAAAGDAATVAAGARKIVQGLVNEIGVSLDGAKLKEHLEEVYATLNAEGGAPSGDAARRAGERLAEIASRITDGTYHDGTAKAGASGSEAFKDQALELVKPALEKLASEPNADALRDIINRIPTTGTAAATVYEGLITLLPRMKADETAHAMVKCFADNIAVNHARKALAELEHHLRKKLKPEVERELGVRPELGKPDLTAALHNLLDQADGDFEKLKTNVEDWFNHSMERVSGWYKRKTILVHVVIAAVLTIFMNIDALVVLRHISADPALRQSLVAQAGNAAKNPPPEAPETGQTVEEATGKAKDLQRQLLDLGLPIGWSLSPTPKGKTEGINLNEYRTPPDWGLLVGRKGANDKESASEEWNHLGRTIRFHGFGWLISIIAASVGAPFWFDLLNKFMNIRSAGKPPAKQPAPDA